MSEPHMKELPALPPDEIVAFTSTSPAPLSTDWHTLYSDRLELGRRWEKSPDAQSTTRTRGQQHTGAGTMPVSDAQESLQGWLQIVEEVLAGKEKIVSHVGASQHNGGGIASCGLAGLNFVRVVLERAKRGLRGGALLEDVLSRRTSEEILSICSRWRSNDHLEVEDIFAVPLFNRALSLVNSTYGEPSFGCFRTVLSDLQSIPNDYAAVVITRPPEIVTCFKLPINSPAGKQNVFIIFDSHPRTSHPNGAGLVLNTSLDATASHLDNLLAVDGRLLVDSSLQWQTQLLANFSGHFFVAKEHTNSGEDLMEAVLDSSLVVLRLQAEVADLKFQNSRLTRDRQSLERSLPSSSKSSGNSRESQFIGTPSASEASSSKITVEVPTKPHRLRLKESALHQPVFRKEVYHQGKGRWVMSDTLSLAYNVAATALHSVTLALSFITWLTFYCFRRFSLNNMNTTLGEDERRRILEHSGSAANMIRRPNPESLDYLGATQLQMDSDIPSHAQLEAALSQEAPVDDDYLVAVRLQRDWDREQRDDALKAHAKQREFEEEDARLLAERTALQQLAQRGFECGVCFDKLSEDDVARVADSGHGFCRDCMKRYVTPPSSGKPTSSRDPQSIAGPSKPSAKIASSSKKPRISNAQAAQLDDDYLVAAQLQRDWEREAVLEALQKPVQRVFECGVCFDEHPEDDVARVADCGHGFCRDCMKGYVVSKLKDKLYPISCPTCMTDAARAEPGVVTDDMVQTLGLDDKQYQILQELQIAPLSILLQCRKCKESVFVDREDYEAEPVLVCPFPTCDHVWCKACQQTIVIGGPKHSCDGSTELEHLMKRRGWKHCPNCKTPFQKTSGCNHITCISPSCNTHFCYLCGETIVRSSIPREIQAAKSAHYASRCPLFEDVPDQ